MGVRGRGFEQRSWFALLVVLCWALPAVAQTSNARLRTLIATAAAMPDVSPSKYVGPGSCSAAACHGGIAPRSTTKVLQNEYSTWITQDRHARAYTVLTGSLSRQMTADLHMGPAEKSQRCLVCHALDAQPEQQAREFDVAEGVSCENCHGPASRWLGPHIQPTAVHADMVRLGLVDNRNLATRTERCLTCHLGARGMDVDHELIAAGHPDLTFELDSFTAIEPPHWVEKSTDPLFGMRAWAVGQAVQLRESMLRVARRADAGPWPEFSEMECMACHHALTGPESWRQKEGYAGHRPGDAPYNLARYVVFRHIADDLDPAESRSLQVAVDEVARLITTMSPDRAAAAGAAKRAAAAADKLVGEMQGAQYSRARADALIAAIAGDADAIARQGERAAEQATMSVDSLYIASARDGAPRPDERAAIDKLFAQVKNPSAYNAPGFAAQLHGVAGTLR